MNKNNALQVIDMALPLGSIDTYAYRVNQIPMLTPEEEQELARRLHDENNVEAARKLVMSHLRFVVRVARGYAGYGLAQADLIQEGNVGLMKAVKRFDPAVGVRLVTFAVHWIKAEIHEFILRNWRIVKVATTKAQRKLFFNLRRMKKRLGWFSREEIEGVANDLGVEPRDVMEMETRMNNYDAAYDGTVEPSDDERLTHFAPAAYLAAPDSDPAEQAEHNDWSHTYQEKLHTALATLDERSQTILQRRWLAEKKATLQDLAAHYSVSAERIRQLEQNAITKLKHAIVETV